MIFFAFVMIFSTFTDSIMFFSTKPTLIPLGILLDARYTCFYGVIPKN